MATIDARKDFELELGFTRIYKEYQNAHRAVREARCLQWQIPRILLDVEEDDLVPGGCHYGAVGFSSQIGGFLYYYREDEIKAEIARCGDNPHRAQKLVEMLRFWRAENSKDRLRAAYTPKQFLAMPTDDWEGTKAVSCPLYRIAGAVLDFGKLLELGIDGLEETVKSRAQRMGADEECRSVCEGMAIALETLRETVCLYEKRARLRKSEAEAAGRSEAAARMQAMAEALYAVRHKPPAHLLEAVELFWMYVVVSEVRNYGRIDDYLGKFYASDIDSGYLTQEQADGIVRYLWKRMAKRRTITDGRVFVGGRGRKDEKSADRLALSCIRATQALREPDPQLSLRFYEGMNPALYEAAMEAIGEGCTYPVLYNDDQIVADVEEAFGLPKEEAVHYVPYGCGEYVIDHKSFGTPSGVINLLKGLEVLLYWGKGQDVPHLLGERGAVMQETLGRVCGIDKTFWQYQDFDEFYGAYKRLIHFHIQVMAQQEKMEYDFADSVCCLPYLSMLYDDCIERGRGLFGGGIRYLGGTLESYGNVNTADSLYAIKKLVFEEKSVEPKKLLEALRADFAGYEALRARLRACDKFGNDLEGPDALMQDLHRFVCLTAKAQAKQVGLDSYLIVVINNSANTSLGLLTGASADGRRAYTPMANANGPQGGADKNGVTAALNSMRKPATNIHAGAVQNIKFSKETFRENRRAVEQVLQAYFKAGGAQLMVTVVGREDLEKAQRFPERYRGLLVRVGGFSARFVELSREVQGEILSRTCY